MPYTVEVKTGVNEGHVLCFAGKSDAREFISFAQAYQYECAPRAEESGAVYILEDDWSLGVYPHVPLYANTPICEGRLTVMANALLKVRTCKNNPDFFLETYVANGPKGIIFQVYNLPDRQKPAVGELYRVFGPEATEEQDLYGEGRVISIIGEDMVVVPLGELDFTTGLPVDSAQVYGMPWSIAMRINNYFKRD